MICVVCRADLGRLERVGRRDTCPRCGVELHSCRQCRFRDVASYNECREPQAERVLEKTRSNFCDYFAAAESGGSVASAAPAKVGKPAAPAAAASGRAGNAREDLDRLFRRK